MGSLEKWQIEILKEVELDLFLNALNEPEYEYSTSNKYQNNILLKLTFAFALASIKFTKQIKNDGYPDLARQLFRCATAIGANSKEAQNAESRADFVHKLKISLKEADEAEYWLFLCHNLEDCTKPGDLIQDLEVILKLLTKIIATSKNRM